MELQILVVAVEVKVVILPQVQWLEQVVRV